MMARSTAQVVNDLARRTTGRNPLGSHAIELARRGLTGEEIRDAMIQLADEAADDAIEWAEAWDEHEAAEARADALAEAAEGEREEARS